MAITDFLQTQVERPQLANALTVLRAFKQCESQEEWLAIRFDAWAKLEQLEEFLAHLVEGKALEQDTLDYIAQHPLKDSADSPTLTPLDLRPGDIIQRKGTDVWFNVEYVFPEKVVIKQTVDVMAHELHAWERVSDYGKVVGAKRTPQG